MKTQMKFLMSAAVMLLLSASLWAQSTFKGQVVDAETGESVPGASVLQQGTTNGTATDIDGNFTLQLSGSGKLIVSFLGYVDKVVKFNPSNRNLGQIAMSSDTQMLGDVVVLASVVTDRKTPVSVSTVSAETIEMKLGSQEYPEILKTTPSIYTSKEGGGFGDATVYVRGFDSNNVGVLINGIPVNDMESGKVYWSNWAGLSDVSKNMQVQRGLGASKLGLSSVGGTINILTKGVDAEKGGVFKAGVGNSGYRKQLVALSTGLLDNGWAVTILGSHTYGKGYIKGTDFDAWSYFANVSKKINDNHTLSFMITGAPQWHNQRGNKHTIEQYRNHKDEFRYNSDYGIREGEIYGGGYGYNYYHKPQAQLIHNWFIDENTALVTSLYASIGNGGGRRVSGEQAGWLSVNNKTGEDDSNTKRTPDGLLDFEAVEEANATYTAKGSQAIIGNSVNNHFWTGLLSNFTKTIDKFKYTTGIDARYYKGEHYREIEDLLGGRFYLDGSDKNRDANTWLKEGDKYSYYNDGIAIYTGVFGQAEYVGEELTGFLSAAVARKTYKRKDYFNYTPEEGQTSDKVNYVPWNVKGGVSYKLGESNIVFANAGYVQRAPTFRNSFLNYKNIVNEDAEYEKIVTAEIGYKFQAEKVNATITAYHTEWKDRGIVRSYAQTTANITGVNQLHQGVEAEITYKPSRKLKLEGMFSYGNWTYKDNVNATIFDESQNKVGEFNAYVKDVHVGNSAQINGSASVSYELLPKLRLSADYIFYGKHYADFEPTKRTSASNGGDSWKMPSVGLVDLGFNYGFKIGKLKSSLYAHVNNVFDTEYVSKADDGVMHSANDAFVYYGFGTTWSVGLKVKF